MQRASVTEEEAVRPVPLVTLVLVVAMPLSVEDSQCRPTHPGSLSALSHHLRKLSTRRAGPGGQRGGGGGGSY